MAVHAVSNWNQPICERDWIAQNAVWDPASGSRDSERLVSVNMPVRLREPELERCSWCGRPTIFGVYVRADPASVLFPALADQ